MAPDSSDDPCLWCDQRRQHRLVEAPRLCFSAQNPALQPPAALHKVEINNNKEATKETVLAHQDESEGVPRDGRRWFPGAGVSAEQGEADQQFAGGE